MKDETISHEEQRKQCWVLAWVHTAGASNCQEKKTATDWADYALSDFDKRFPKPEIKSETE